MLSDCTPSDQQDALPEAGFQSHDEHTTAERLYRRYASGIRFYLRRANPERAIEESVLTVLVRVARKLRAMPNIDEERIVPAVLECTREEADSIRVQPGWRTSIQADYSLQGRAKLVNTLFARLTPQERAILMRAYLLNEPDSRVAKVTGLTADAIAEVRSRARRHFGQIAASQGTPGDAIN